MNPDAFWQMAYRDAYQQSHNTAALALRMAVALGFAAGDTAPHVMPAGELLTLERLTRFAYHYWCQADAA